MYKILDETEISRVDALGPRTRLNGLYKNANRKGIPPESIEQYVEPVMAKAMEILLKNQEAKKQSFNDPRLSSRGRREVNEEISKKDREEVEKLIAELPFDKIEGNIKATMTVVPLFNKDDLLQNLQIQEMRTMIRQNQKPLEIERNYLRYNQTGENLLYVAAVESSPAPFGLVSAEVLSKGKTSRISRKYPAQAEELNWVANMKMLTMDFLDSTLKVL